mmetsp:Transcript_43841/g.146068  ORF Transcript_43841/g.146068 Transcript_43841/m.146068 type:complete len:205 (+) Transcript_43841:277-891(+)
MMKGAAKRKSYMPGSVSSFSASAISPVQSMLSAGSIAMSSNRFRAIAGPCARSTKGSQSSAPARSAPRKSWCSAAAKAVAQPTMKKRNWAVSRSIFSSITTSGPIPKYVNTRKNHAIHMKSRPNASSSDSNPLPVNLEAKANETASSSPSLIWSLDVYDEISSIRWANIQRSSAASTTMLRPASTTSSASIVSAGQTPSGPLES